MKKSRKNTIFLILFCLLIVTAITLLVVFALQNKGTPIGGGNVNTGVTNPNEPNVRFDDGTDKKNIYKDNNQVIDNARFTYEDVNVAAEEPITPSKGDVNILVVPVEFKSSFSLFESIPLIDFEDNIPFKNHTYLDAIETTFNSTNNPYWESVKTYYEKSSFGNLNFNFDVTDVYTPTLSASDFIEKEDGGTSALGSQDLLLEIFNNTLNGNSLTLDGKAIDLFDSRYDSNSDGNIDGIWMIYNCDDQSFVSSKQNGTPFWAYTTNLYAVSSPDSEDETSNEDETEVIKVRYANCAISFMFDDSSDGYDAHTIIHETGHMLGLDDYYSYDNNFGNYGYLGGVDMMDLNVGDHDTFSKFALGWIKPTVIYQKETTITLKPSSSSGDALIIPSSYFNDSAFGEYLILEYKTPEGLNELDYNVRYNNNYPKTYGNGLAIYHVDARLALHEFKGQYYTVTKYLSKDETSIPQRSGSDSNYSSYLVATSNTPSYNGIDSTQTLIELVSKSRTLYSQDNNISHEATTTQDLYQEGDSLNSYQLDRFFPNGYFYNGTDISNLSIYVESMDSNGITLTIKR